MSRPRTDRDGSVAGFLWSRHANPASVWTLLAAYPALLVGLYRRDRSLLAGTLLFVALNPFLFPPPGDDDAWATRVVLGERRWLADGLGTSPFDAALIAVGAPVNLYALRSAIRRDAVGMVLGTALSLATTLLFFVRMARLYETREG